MKGLTGLIKSDEDVDEQLLVTIPFKENVKVKGIMIKAETKLSGEWFLSLTSSYITTSILSSSLHLCSISLNQVAY